MIDAQGEHYEITWCDVRPVLITFGGQKLRVEYHGEPGDCVAYVHSYLLGGLEGDN